MKSPKNCGKKDSSQHLLVVPSPRTRSQRAKEANRFQRAKPKVGHAAP